MCESRRAALAQRPSCQTSQEAFARAGRGGAGARQPRVAQLAPLARSGPPSRAPLAHSTYAGFNDHHLCEKLCEVEGVALSRETLRRLREAGLGSPRKRRAPTHRQRRLRSAQLGELVQPMAVSMIGSKDAAPTHCSRHARRCHRQFISARAILGHITPRYPPRCKADHLHRIPRSMHRCRPTDEFCF